MKAAIIFHIIVATLFALSSCNNTQYNERYTIPEGRWKQNNKARFELTINDTIQSHQFSISLRHMENYRYSNLFVFLHTTMPNGNVTHDTLECTLAMPNGRWIGKGSGSMRDIKVILNPALRFPLKGNYIFEIEQAMREEPLIGIADIGITIQ